MKKIRVFTPIKDRWWHSCLSDIMEAMARSLRELGQDAFVDMGGNLPPADINIAITGDRAFNPQTLPSTSVNVLFQVESRWELCKAEVYGKGKFDNGWDVVLELFKECCDTPHHDGIDVRHFPFGYSPIFDWQLPVEDCVTDNDCLFYGVNTTWRNRCYEALKEAKFKTIISGALWGEERDLAILRSAVTLSIAPERGLFYGPLRALLAQCKGCFVLSEKASGGYGPYQPGVHFQEFLGIQDLLTKARWWIEHRRTRQEFEEAARDDLLLNHHINRYLKEALHGYI